MNTLRQNSHAVNTPSNVNSPQDAPAQRGVFARADYVRAAGDGNAGIMLSQLIYWTPKAAPRDGWIWKSAREWEEETGLDEAKQKSARRELERRGLIEVVLRGVPATLHFRVNLDRLRELLTGAAPVERSEGVAKRTQAMQRGHQEWRERSQAEGAPAPRKRKPRTSPADNKLVSRGSKIQFVDFRQTSSSNIGELLQRVHRDDSKTTQTPPPPPAVEAAPAREPVCVSEAITSEQKSKFSYDEWLAFAKHLQSTGQGIINPVGYAKARHKSGEDDALLSAWKNGEQTMTPKPAPAEAQFVSPDQLCTTCFGSGMEVVPGKGARRCPRCKGTKLEPADELATAAR